MIKRLATPRRGDDVIRIDTRRRQARITSDDVSTLRTGEIHNKINRQLKQWTELHFHTNRDGTIALAYGNEPDLWPEDDTSERGGD